MKKATKGLAVGALIAGVAGYVTGVLTAPKSGKETRNDIKDGVSQGLAEAEKQLKHAHTELDGLVTDAKDKLSKLSGSAEKPLSDILDRAKAAKEKVRVMLSAVHEGDADDKDLEKAIKEANAAIDHLKDYLKK